MRKRRRINEQNINSVRKAFADSGVLIIAGLVVELITLRWSLPTAYLFFLLIGGVLIAIGILIYLYSLVTDSQTDVKAASTD